MVKFYLKTFWDTFIPFVRLQKRKNNTQIMILKITKCDKLQKQLNWINRNKTNTLLAASNSIKCDILRNVFANFAPQFFWKRILAKQFLTLDKTFPLELGGQLVNPTVAYTTYGTLNANKDNVVWVFHALTAASNAEEWWPGMIGKDSIFNSDK